MFMSVDEDVEVAGACLDNELEVELELALALGEDCNVVGETVGGGDLLEVLRAAVDDGAGGGGVLHALAAVAGVPVLQHVAPIGIGVLVRRLATALRVDDVLGPEYPTVGVGLDLADDHVRDQPVGAQRLATEAGEHRTVDCFGEPQAQAFPLPRPLRDAGPAPPVRRPERAVDVAP